MIVIVFILAVLLGLISGLVPGLHSNTIVSIFSSLGLAEQDFAVLIVAVLAVHTLLSFIPSIFFGVPDQQTVVSALAGQQLVRRGKGLTALKVVTISALFAALLSVALFYFSLDWFPILYNFIRPFMAPLLLVLSIVLLWRSKQPLLSLGIFLLSGLLGVYTLNSSMFDPFLPLFAGLFAMGAILTYKPSKIPAQKDEPISPNILKFSLLGVIGGFFADLLPGISSPSQVAVLLAIFVPMHSLAYLASISSISVSEAIFSFSTAASIEKSRIGATVWLSRTIPIEENLLFILVVFLVAITLAGLLLYFARKFFAKLANLDFTMLNKLLAIYLIAAVFLLNGLEGLVIFALASAVGFLTIKLDVERRNLMGAVIVPTLLLLFKIFII